LPENIAVHYGHHTREYIIRMASHFIIDFVIDSHVDGTNITIKDILDDSIE